MSENQMLEYRVEELEKEVETLKKSNESINLKLVNIENNISNIDKSLQSIVLKYEQVADMSYTMRSVSEKLDLTLKKGNEQDNRLRALEEKDGKLAVKAWVYILGIGASMLAGAFFAYVFPFLKG